MIPWSYRIRSTHPIVDRHLGCRAVLDLERSMLIPVPDEFRLHLASALELGASDEVLMAWLREVDLMTSDANPGREGSSWEPVSHPAQTATAARWVSFGGRSEWHFDRFGAGSVQELARLLEDKGLSGRHSLVVGAEEAVADSGLLIDFLTVALQSASPEPLAIHLTLSPKVVTRGVVEALRRLKAQVTVRWNLSPEVDPDAEAGRIAQALHRLRPALPREPEVDAVLGPEDRLLEFWHRARAAGVRRVEGIQVEHRLLHSIHHVGAVSGFANDLAKIIDETFDDLASGAAETLYQPVARVVGHLVQQETLSGQQHAGSSPREAERSACSACWAKEFCSRNRGAIDLGGSGRRFAPNEDRCDFWRAEVHAAMLLFERLREEDPVHFLNFPVEVTSVPAPLDPFAAFDMSLDFDQPS